MNFFSYFFSGTFDLNQTAQYCFENHQKKRAEVETKISDLLTRKDDSFKNFLQIILSHSFEQPSAVQELFELCHKKVVALVNEEPKKVFVNTALPFLVANLTKEPQKESIQMLHQIRNDFAKIMDSNSQWTHIRFLQGGRYIQLGFEEYADSAVVYIGKDLRPTEEERTHERNLGESIFVRIECYEAERLRKRPDVKARLLAGVEVLKRINHPNVVCLRDFFEEEGSQYLVLDHSPVGTLKSYLQKQKQLPEKEALALFKQLRNAVKYLRDQNQQISHRNINWRTIVLDYDEKGAIVVRLQGFQLARVLNDDDLSNSIIDTDARENLPFLAPEARRGQASSKMDLWSLGVVLYCLLYGEVPLNTEGVVPILLPPHVPLSEEARSLLGSLLAKKDETRISWEAFFVHPFIYGEEDRKKEYEKQLQQLRTQLGKPNFEVETESRLVKEEFSELHDIRSLIATRSSIIQSLEVDLNEKRLLKSKLEELAKLRGSVKKRKNETQFEFL